MLECKLSECISDVNIDYDDSGIHITITYMDNTTIVVKCLSDLQHYLEQDPVLKLTA